MSPERHNSITNLRSFCRSINCLDKFNNFYVIYDKYREPVLELVISCTMYEDDGGEDGFNAVLPDFMEDVNKIFGGHMPETLRKCIESEVEKREANRF